MKREHEVIDGPSCKRRKSAPRLATNESLQGAFIGQTCIPLWPKYKLPDLKETFIKGHQREKWFREVIQAARLRYPDSKRAMCVKNGFLDRLGNTIMGTLKALVAKARSEHRRATRTRFPHVIKVTYGRSELTVSSRLRNIMVEANDACNDWISRELVREIEGALRNEASSQDSDSSPSSAKPHWNYRCNGDIRGKVTWHQPTRSWKLNMKDPKQDLRHYLQENGLTLTVGVGLRKSSAAEARYATYITACKVWNALDSSKKYRIKLRDEAHVETSNIPEQAGVVKKMQVSDSESEGSEQSSPE